MEWSILVLSARIWGWNLCIPATLLGQSEFGKFYTWNLSFSMRPIRVCFLLWGTIWRHWCSTGRYMCTCVHLVYVHVHVFTCMCKHVYTHVYMCMEARDQCQMSSSIALHFIILFVYLFIETGSQYVALFGLGRPGWPWLIESYLLLLLTPSPKSGIKGMCLHTCLTSFFLKIYFYWLVCVREMWRVGIHVEARGNLGRVGSLLPSSHRSQDGTQDLCRKHLYTPSCLTGPLLCVQLKVTTHKMKIERFSKILFFVKWFFSVCVLCVCTWVQVSV